MFMPTSLKRRIDQRVANLTGRTTRSIDYAQPKGDPGLFGPESAVWRVHGDFVSMLCGGVGALLLQMLHPLALSGVWDHSTFRDDMMGRLRRTSQFIAVTTYGSRQDAQSAIAHVRHIHSFIKGTSPDGQAYHADDPELLCWVHVAEMSRFLAAYIRYCEPTLGLDVQDAYYRESARVAIALGAESVPTSTAEVTAYLEEMRPQLRCDERTREVARILQEAGPEDPLGRMAGRLFMRGGIDLLPQWALEALGMQLSPVKRMTVRKSLHVLRPIVTSSVTGTACELARERVGASKTQRG